MKQGRQYNCCMLGLGQIFKKICDIRYLLSRLRIKLKDDRSKLRANIKIGLGIEYRRIVKDEIIRRNGHILYKQ